MLLGRGGFSCCYEMYDEKNPKRHYAAKVIGFENKAMSSELILRTTQLQYFLGEQSENIVRILTLWELKISVDETGDIQNVWYPDSDAWEERGILRQIILMEKLDSVLSKDKYKNTTLSRESLKSETEVVQFAGQIGRAILTVHNNNVLHRDIRLENIFWDENLGQYKLGDFGIAKLVEEGNAVITPIQRFSGNPFRRRRRLGTIRLMWSKCTATRNYG